MSESVLLCFLISMVLSHAGFLFTVGEKHIEIVQRMTVCISCLLCCQDNLMISRKAGINRIIITFIGGLVGNILSFLISFVINAIVASSGAMGVERYLSYIPIWLAAASMIFAVFVGMAAGYFPALRAMRLSPLAAIHNE